MFKDRLGEWDTKLCPSLGAKDGSFGDTAGDRAQAVLRSEERKLENQAGKLL